MKVLILAGGFGSRLAEETALIPKPMVEIGNHPIIWHIMKIYSFFGFNEFIILLGYKGYIIKEYFFNYFLHQNDVTIDLSNNSVKIHRHQCEPWIVTLIDTGQNSMTGGRILRAAPFVNNETFMLTYGDGVSDINIKNLVKYHKIHGKIATMTSVQPEGRFGTIETADNGSVLKFIEKPSESGNWINAGFFVLEPEIFSHIKNGDSSIFEREPLESLAMNNELYTYKHRGFWKCMDTIRDKENLQELWNSENAPWRLWE